MMSTLTAVLYGLLAVYLGGWFLGYWTGNFAAVLFVLSVVTMAYWLAERFVFRPRRLAAAETLRVEAAQRRERLKAQGIQQVDGEADLETARARIVQPPWWVEWTAGMFPVIVLIFLVRSFLFEPFRIPSGSMIPTLQVGDLILVNKFHYGVRLPVVNTKIFANHDPQRGDVMVFRYPVDPRVDYIKRVVGIPGDEVAYLNQRLYLNGKEIVVQPAGEHYDEEAMRVQPMFREGLGPKPHLMQVDPKRQAFFQPMDAFNRFRDQCHYSAEGVRCKVPAGHAFMMGDNRDNSLDSRFWGFVPYDNIVGKAVFVWMNFGNLKRIGSFD